MKERTFTFRNTLYPSGSGLKGAFPWCLILSIQKVLAFPGAVGAGWLEHPCELDLWGIERHWITLSKVDLKAAEVGIAWTRAPLWRMRARVRPAVSKRRVMARDILIRSRCLRRVASTLKEGQRKKRVWGKRVWDEDWVLRPDNIHRKFSSLLYSRYRHHPHIVRASVQSQAFGRKYDKRDKMIKLLTDFCTGLEKRRFRTIYLQETIRPRLLNFETKCYMEGHQPVSGHRCNATLEPHYLIYLAPYSGTIVCSWGRFLHALWTSVWIHSDILCRHGCFSSHPFTSGTKSLAACHCTSARIFKRFCKLYL